jgi:hypothetical protein
MRNGNRAGCPTKNDPNDLDPGSGSMDRISEMADVPEIQAERIFHETKFVFLSCAQARTGSVVHTTVDADVTSAWSHTTQSIKLATTHNITGLPTTAAAAMNPCVTGRKMRQWKYYS